MTDANGPVNPPPVPPVPAASSTGAAATPPPRQAATTTAKGPGIGGSIAAAIVALLLADLAVETFVAGSPVRLAVLGIAALALVVLALSWTRAGAAVRLALPLVGLACAIAWTVLRIGSWADPGLRMATFTLPRLGIALAIAGTVAAVGLLFGLRLVRRAWYVGAAVALVAVYALVPLVRGLLAGAPLAQVLGGSFDWQRLPAQLQGGYLATELVLPIGLLAGLAATVLSVARRTRAAWVLAGLVLVIAAFVTQSAELTRAGRSHLAGALTSPLLARVSSVVVPPGGAVAFPGTGAAGSGAVTTPFSSPSGSADATGSGGVAQGTNAADQTTTATVVPAPPGAVAVAQVGQPASSKAVEVRVTGHHTAGSIGPRSADAGRELVIVESSWKNILPKVKVNRKKAQDRTAGMGSLGFGGGATARDKAADEANTTIESVPFEVSPLEKHLWLVVDGRYAQPLDIEATNALEGHIGPAKLGIAQFEQVVSGGLVFEAPAGASALALLFLDAVNGHLIVTITGAPPVLAGGLGGTARANQFVDLAVTGASWSDSATAAAGLRTLVVGVKGISRGNNIVDVPFGEYAFLQTEQGCLAEPDARAAGLTRQLAPMGRFIPFVPSEGQLAFQVPADTKSAALLVRLQQGGPIDLPVMGAAKPAWPAAEATVQDGDVLRVLKLPGTAVPPGFAAGPAGSERLALDLVVENLRAGAGIDLQPDQQFRIVTPDGERHEPAHDSLKVPCRLSGPVPAGGARRFTLIYDVPPGQPLQMEYRGFNVQSELVKVR